MIKVVDIFAGPGGLSEGFSRFEDNDGNRVFDIALSIEKENYAHQTLKLRALLRSFTSGFPDDYYHILRAGGSLDALYSLYPEQTDIADMTCWKAELGSPSARLEEVRSRIGQAVGPREDWVLIGGPPCQAYSIAGRSRNASNPRYNSETDVRQRLYVEYLQILADHRPAVFVMENVKGLLSASHRDERMFQRILSDLRTPAVALAREGRNTLRSEGQYRMFSLVKPQMFEDGEVEGSVVRAELYGVPQARHRVILLGLRNDLTHVRPQTLVRQPVVTLEQVLDSLPPLRSGLSKEEDSAASWEAALRSQVCADWVKASAVGQRGDELRGRIQEELRVMKAPQDDRGGAYVAGSTGLIYQRPWYVDERLGGICNHKTRAHIRDDIWRYMYATTFAELYGRSPTLKDFPKALWPAHKNVETAVADGSMFSDRFRVQLPMRPSTTVVSHISKDGHYYIHYDPGQCRSLTVREAARLQTFPDNYVFCGPTTAQFVQVGNAVPPLLAHQIASVVSDALAQAGAQ